MVLSKREKKAGIIAAIAVALLCADQFLYEPYAAEADQLDKDLSAAKQQQSDDEILFAKKRKLEKVWNEMKSGGLQSDITLADSQAQRALIDWSSSSRVNVSALKSNHAEPEGPFQLLSYDINGDCAMSTAARLIWALETSKIPLRINEMELSSRTEGSDTLVLRLNVSTICMPTLDTGNSNQPTTQPAGAQ